MASMKRPGTRRGRRPARATIALAQAYLGARYQIDTRPPVILRIGQPQPALRALAQASGSVFLTACNPRSRRLSVRINARRMRELQRMLARRGCTWLPGHGLDAAGQWPDEPSLWVPDLPLAAGLRLARRFGQNALVWCGPDTVAHLVWTRRAPGSRSRSVRRRSACLLR